MLKLRDSIDYLSELDRKMYARALKKNQSEYKRLKDKYLCAA